MREADAFGKGDGDDGFAQALLRREGLSLVAIIELETSPTTSEIAKVGMTSRNVEAGRRTAEDPRSRSSSARTPDSYAAWLGWRDVGDPKKNLRTTGDPPESTRESAL